MGDISTLDKISFIHLSISYPLSTLNL